MGMGGTQRSAKFVKYLPAFHWQPVVVTVKDVHYYAHDDSLLQEISNRQIIRTESLDPLRLLARFSGVRPDKNRSNRPASPNFKAKILNRLNQFISGWLCIPDSKILWLPYAITSSLSIMKRKKISVIFTTSPPHSAHLGGLVLKLLTGAKWVADFRDDWSGGESQASPTFLHTSINRLFEKFVLKLADSVVGMCDPLTENLKNKSGDLFKNDKFHTIMNGYDRDDFSGLENVPINQKFTIAHCGSISRVSDPEPFLKAIQLLFQQNSELREQIQVQFFGTDIYGRLESLLKLTGLEQSICGIRYLPHKQALKKIMQSHLLLLTIFKRTGEEIITGKVFEYLASGKPILMISSEGEVARIVRSLNRGTVVEHSNIEGIAEAILSYFNAYQNGKLSFSDPFSTKEFDRKILTRKLADIFEKSVL